MPVTHRLILLIAIALALPVTPALAQVRPVPADARVSLVFDAGTTFVLGDPIEFTFVLANRGTTAFDYATGGDYRGTGFPMRYKFAVTDQARVPLPAETFQDLGGFGGSTPLAAGGEFRERLRLQNYVRLTQPGTFTVRVTHDFGWQATAGRPLPVAAATITVTAPTPAQVDARLQALAADHTALRELELGAIWHQTPYRNVAYPAYLSGLEKQAGGGELNAFEAIDRILTPEATRSLTRLLSGANVEVVHAATLFLMRRLPVRRVDGQPRGWRWYPTEEDRAAHAALWLEEAREPLLKAGRTLLASGNVQQVRTGAFVIESIGVPADGPRVLEAFGPVLRDVHDREKPDENILENPGAADALIAALAGLRERGYRAPDSGGVEVILAQFLQWGDPAMPRRRGWEDTLEAFMSQRPALLREVGLRALPSPPDGRWEKVLLKALDDRDRGVMRAACEVAGASGNPRFVEALANIVRGEQHEWVVGSASEALLKLGARAAAADAWIERLADAKLYPAALRFLAKTLEHPATSSSSGRTDASREARFALREKWRRFFTDPERMALVQAGKPVPVTEDQARDLFGGVFAFDLEGNRKWPGLSSVSPAGSDPAPPPPR